MPKKTENKTGWMHAIRLTSGALCLHAYCQAAVLPEDRSDVMYHRYDGGGVTIDGPSILIRKSMLDNLSVSLNHYVDNVTSASIDVKVFASGASQYTEQREEQSLGLTYLNNNTTMNLGYTNSEESDYSADTAYMGISQDFFGNLSTLSMNYALGDDVVRQNTYQGDEIVSTDDVGTVARQNYRLGFTQVVTKNLVMNATMEAITDEGFLNNPYRRVRFMLPDGSGTDNSPEIYPETRTSDAIALRASYYWPWWKAAVKFETRRFNDSWGINGITYELKYTHPLLDDWLLEGKIRRYTQNAADFYSDLFPYENFQNFVARDKELSSYATFTLGAGATWEWKNIELGFIDKLSFNLYVDYVNYQYDDFRDATESRGANPSALAGQESLYEYNAFIWRAFVSLYY